jgi:alpha-galactosidase
LKIAFIGAGSFGFTRKVVRDILSIPALSGATIALMDIDKERLAHIKQAVERIVSAGGYGARVEATTDRAKALDGADGVVITILVGGVKIWRYDIEVPKEFGVDINVGDTRGPAGIFRALRTIPVILEIAADIERYAPRAIVLNYTNPMAMLCRAVQATSRLTFTGLCHSVQGTAEMLARWIGATMDRVTYTCAGINHQAWYLDYRWDGEDAYPLIREAVQRPEIYNEEQVRNEMFLHLDYYVTESSGHNSEYNAWFRKRPDLIERYCTTGTGWNPGKHAYILEEYRKREATWKDEILKWLGQEKVDLTPSNEYAASIFDATIGSGRLFTFNGNVRNTGLIENLPTSACVEVPVVASHAGLQSVHVGPLPTHLAVLTGANALCEELAVQASLEGDERKVFHAICMDPLTSAVLGLAEIRDMVRALFEKNRDWLPQFPR